MHALPVARTRRTISRLAPAARHGTKWLSYGNALHRRRCQTETTRAVSTAATGKGRSETAYSKAGYVRRPAPRISHAALASALPLRRSVKAITPDWCGAAWEPRRRLGGCYFGSSSRAGELLLRRTTAGRLTFEDDGVGSQFLCAKPNRAPQLCRGPPTTPDRDTSATDRLPAHRPTPPS
jgi:hypothetical protein